MDLIVTGGEGVQKMRKFCGCHVICTSSLFVLLEPLQEDTVVGVDEFDALVAQLVAVCGIIVRYFGWISQKQTYVRKVV